MLPELNLKLKNTIFRKLKLIGDCLTPPSDLLQDCSLEKSSSVEDIEMEK